MLIHLLKKNKREASEILEIDLFEDEGLYIKQLNLNYEYNDNLLSVGKIRTNFSKSAYRKDNIWLFEEARKNYREDEKIGIANYTRAGDEKNQDCMILVCCFY